MSHNKLTRRDTPSKLNQGLSIAKISSVVVKRDTLSVNNNHDKSTPLSLIASPTIIKKFRRKNDEVSVDGKGYGNAQLQIANSRQYIVEQQHETVDDERPRSSTWAGRVSSEPVPLAIMNFDSTIHEKIKKFTLNMERKSKSFKKLRELVEKVLRKNLEHAQYDPKLSKMRCTHLSQILETTFKTSLNVGNIEYKVVAVVYIGEIRDDGMRQSCQYNWNPNTDLFVMETYRRDDMFATGIVFATLLDNRDDVDDNSNHFFDEKLEDDEILI